MWDKLSRAQATDFRSLLSAAEIAAWRDRTLDGFEVDAGTSVELTYITEDMLASLIGRAAEMAAGHLERWTRRVG